MSTLPDATAARPATVAVPGGTAGPRAARRRGGVGSPRLALVAASARD